MLRSEDGIDGGAFSRNLPIRDGSLVLDVPMEDRLAHHYVVAIEVVRRREFAFRESSNSRGLHIKAPKLNQLDVEGSAGDYPATTGRIHRTKSLTPYALVATPLDGAVQGLVYVHPASYAAQASAVNKARGQYSGQHVGLLRHVADFEAFNRVYETWGRGGIRWIEYANWAEARREAILQEGPTELNPARQIPQTSQDMAPHPMTPVERTELGIFGVDRYVYPDVPPDYEYRVFAYSTAGLVHSPWTVSAFVRPAFEPVWRENIGDDAFRDRRGRLTPEAPTEALATACRPASEEAGVPLQLDVPLVTPFDHMTPKARALWVESDTRLFVDSATSTAVRFGLLPDIRAEYQIYLAVNYEEYASRIEGPMLVPVIKIHPIMKSRTLREKDSFHFAIEVVQPGVKLLPVPGLLPANDSVQLPHDPDLQVGNFYPVLPNQPKKPAKGNPLSFKILLDLSDGRCERFAQVALRAIEGAAPEQIPLPGFLFVDISREGNRSIMRAGNGLEVLL